MSPLSSTVIIKTINKELTGDPTIDEITSGVQFTPSLIPGVLTDIAVNKDLTTNKVGEQTQYNITFTVVTAVDAGGHVKVTFPTGELYTESGTAVECKNATGTSET